FQDAGVTVRREAFTMPALWLERSASATVTGDEVSFAAPVAAMPYSVGTGPEGLTAPLLDGGDGSEEAFAALGSQAEGAFLLMEQTELQDIAGLFAEYNHAAAVESRAFAAGARGVVYMGSRPRGTLYRHNASLGPQNRAPMLVMSRMEAGRALRLLRDGEKLQLKVVLDIDSGPAYEVENVIGEIRGHGQPEEFVVIGAHLDSWGLGTGALDNGCNVAMVVDMARQMQRLGIRPRRTIRFALWNGEEQGLYGSLGYVRRHQADLDRHVMASSYDIGSGRINGFFTGGRPALAAAVSRALEPVRGLGPFTVLDIPIVGTDNYDFMMEGVGNLVANQESANYGPNYHAATDTFDKVDLRQLRLNGAIAAAVTLGFANMEVDWSRQTRAELEALIQATDLGDQMRTFGFWADWLSGNRGRSPR
ncbi:MAG: M20/M25/M40 family metallo-hydrolase, partial [Gemmatimonadetes bacterium]|nr:M20/M25/M40 family metallo-hydrolase [Gemmatimonadota bacterium]